MPDIPDYLEGNIAGWEADAANYVGAGERNWATDRPSWGIWGIDESEVHLLPHDLQGLDCIEIGCGTAYVSAWMCRRGARVTGIDPTPGQLATARRLREQHGLDLRLDEGYAEALPYEDGSFDFAISEYGAALWADPYQWIPEAARVLRPGGRLVLLTNSAFVALCAPELEADGPTGEALLRPYLGMHRITYPDAPGQTEFHLPHGEWIALFNSHGFVVEALRELGAPPGSSTRYAFADHAWAQKWPTEDVWMVRKR